ncbi:macrophage receptor MARCO-like, partial [Patella vulgata]|uniref:macrophage receptor MARCO-like n=1 Tax=Patella vulgata TaxID=6465 RepID=UPI0024A93CBA
MLILQRRNLIKCIILTLWIFVENAEPQNITLEGLSVRLASGRKLGEGRVEIRYNSSMAWGTICRDYWDDVDATVLCRMLGYRWGSVSTESRIFVKGSGPIYMDNVQCRGNENMLTKCVYNGWGKHNCQHAEDIGVRCFNHSSSYSVSLVGGGADYGRVEITVDEETGTICDNKWSNNDAKVVCQHL